MEHGHMGGGGGSCRGGVAERHGGVFRAGGIRPRRCGDQGESLGNPQALEREREEWRRGVGGGGY